MLIEKDGLLLGDIQGGKAQIAWLAGHEGRLIRLPQRDANTIEAKYLFVGGEHIFLFTRRVSMQKGIRVGNFIHRFASQLMLSPREVQAPSKQALIQRIATALGDARSRVHTRQWSIGDSRLNALAEALKLLTDT